MKPAISRLDEQSWDTWPEHQIEERGTVSWKDLLGSGPSNQANMLMGVVRVRTGEILKPHRHTEPETYYTLSGQGVVGIDGQSIPVQAGTALFIPGDALHHIENSNEEDLLILYSFAVDNWEKVVYRF